jgi:hypothetical protein
MEKVDLGNAANLMKPLVMAAMKFASRDGDKTKKNTEMKASLKAKVKVKHG